MPRVRKNTSEFGKMILKRLVDLDETQKSLAEKCGLSYNFINALITGRYLPSIKTIKKLSDALDIELKTLAETAIKDL